MDRIQCLNATAEVVFILNPELDFVVDADTLKWEVKGFHCIFDSTSGCMRVQGNGQNIRPVRLECQPRCTWPPNPSTRLFCRTDVWSFESGNDGGEAAAPIMQMVALLKVSMQ